LLASKGIKCDVLYVGSEKGLEHRVADKEGIPFEAIQVGKLRRDRNALRLLSAANLRDAFKVPQGIAQAVGIVVRFNPDVVFATGGYVSVPVSVAARLCRKPLVIHEQTVRLGLANRLLARFATRVAISSAESLELIDASVRERAVVTGNPTRPDLANGDRYAALQALAWTGWTPGLPTVYVTGGSQGAVQVNQLLTALLPGLLTQANVLHQCGTRWLPELQERAAGLPPGLRDRYRLAGFVDDELPDALALADVLVARSGAGMVAELTALGKPSVLIPLSTAAGDEQAHNARHLARAGAAIALIGPDATPARLQQALDCLLADAQVRQEMAHAARQLGQPDATEALTLVVLELCIRPHRTLTPEQPSG
jgi:UDP-N-acetylglucosamine--N-acetylmuramyl-(pentapeptide) pyrophosphoryl-undecaprenol N-acetylglucosamine transferase